jgi:hypothetical protein
MPDEKGDTLRPPPSSFEPCCKACGRARQCTPVKLGSEVRWPLCADLCFPAFLAQAQGWLAQEQRHAELLADAAREDAELAELGVGPG